MRGKILLAKKQDHQVPELVPGGPASTHVEGDIGITVVDPVVAGASGDHGKDDHPETVHEACPWEVYRSTRRVSTPRAAYPKGAKAAGGQDRDNATLPELA
jgi:hypothetical protein